MYASEKCWAAIFTLYLNFRTFKSHTSYNSTVENIKMAALSFASKIAMRFREKEAILEEGAIFRR